MDQFQGYPTLPSDQFQGYPTLPSEESDTEQDRMESQEANILEAIIAADACKFSGTEIGNRSVKEGTEECKQKEENKSFAKTWEENATTETYDSIARVVAKLEKQKKPDRSLSYLQILRTEVDAGEADQNTHAELSKAEEAFSKTPYDGNPETVFQWCEKFEKHLARFNWE